MLRAQLIAVLAVGMGLVAVNARAEETVRPLSPSSLLKAIDQGFVEIFEKVSPSVVVIEATKAPDEEDREGSRAFEFFFKKGEEPSRKPGPNGKEPLHDKDDEWKLPPTRTRSEGSGFVVRADGLILTNHHVVADAEALRVRLKDGRTFPAKVQGFDDKTDIAVLRIEAKGLPVIEWGDSEALRVGQLVCAIGTPFNQDFSFTTGVVSGKNRTNLLGPTSTNILYEDYLQTDAFINPGNSGGPLFDVEGKVVGMNTLINGLGRGLAFAIPSTMLREVADQLIARGKVQRPWLGIRIETLSDNSALHEHLGAGAHGVLVDTIEADAPAYKSDLRPADVIVEVDGVSVASARDLQRQILRKKIGQVIQLTVWRSGAVLKIAVPTGELPGELTKVSNAQPPKSRAGGGEAMGLQLKDADGASGAVVTGVAAESPAAAAQMLTGDLITAVEAKVVAGAEACVQAITAAAQTKGRDGVLLNLDRKGRRCFVLLRPPSRTD